MLQSSQIEKPRCSATTDQMRLRRAMYLPVDSQNFSFSGFQSEIQVRFRLLISTFLCGREWSPVVSRPALPRLDRAKSCSRAPQRHTDASCVLSYVKSCSTRNGSTVRRSVGSAINKPIDVLSRVKSAKSEAQLQSDPERVVVAS